MTDKLKCFVIIGYGKKTSFAAGKVRKLDLDETFKYLIKPVFDSFDIICYRAIDKNLTGSIDKVMLSELKNADLALVDLSTLNANVMWELGVRHALKPHHTIMICEKEQMNELPFDINHFPVHQYAHSEEGIPYKEVDRFRTHLSNIVNGILEQDPMQIDSPVHLFLKEEIEDNGIPKVKAFRRSKNVTSFVEIIEKAENYKNSTDYENALKELETAKRYAENSMALKDHLNLIISRQALCTYKLKKPNEQDALLEAKRILQELNPHLSNDNEVLGLSGAIDKRLYEITQDFSYLESSIFFYEKGFQLKQDYYNGINVSFMLYLKVSILKNKGDNSEDIKVKADYIRNTVLDICLNLESDDKFLDFKDAIWILLTIAEAYIYKHNPIKTKDYEDKASALAKIKKDNFALDSYHQQKQKILSFYK